MTPETQAALARLQRDQLHGVHCPWPARPCQCQHIADLAHVAQALADAEAANEPLTDAAANVVQAMNDAILRNQAHGVPPGVYAALEILAALLDKERADG